MQVFFEKVYYSKNILKSIRKNGNFLVCYIFFCTFAEIYVKVGLCV